MSTVVSVTPLAVDRDSRTFKQASSIERLGYRSVVVEGEASAPDARGLPFELISARSARPGAGGAPAASRPAAPEAAAAASGLAGRLPAPLARAVSRAIAAAQRLAEPPIALAAYVRANLRTLRALPEASLYVLHSYNQFPAVYLRARRARARYVYDAHDSYWEEDPSLDTLFRARLTRRMFERVELLCAERAAELVTVSDGVAGLLERRFGRRPLVLRNAADLRLERPSPADVRSACGLPEDAFLLVMPGNAKPGDTIEEALEAISQLPDSVHLALVGSGHEPFAEAAREHGVADRVHPLPPVPPTEVASFISTADAAPILYRAWTVNFQQALPNRFYHAIAAGLPLLYPPLREIERLAERYELGVPIDPAEPRSVAAGVRRLLDDPGLLARLAGNVERARGELSWEHEERALAALLRAELTAGESG